MLAASLIIFLTILGAVCAVMMGYAFYRLVGGSFDDPGPQGSPPAQAEYMRQVRYRSRLAIYFEARHITRPEKLGQDA
jgi:hypothetical protein